MEPAIQLELWQSDDSTTDETAWLEGAYLIGLGSVFFEAVLLSLALYIVR